jgi:hypothetical protein
MLTIIKNLRTASGRSAATVLGLLFCLAFSGSVRGQNAVAVQSATEKVPVQKTVSAAAPLPVASIYKEVKIGTDADEVRKLLGKAKIDDKDGFYYDMGPEIVQIRLDENAKVRVISVTYPTSAANAPKYADIFGDDAMEVKPDGSVYRLVRYPEAGYWVAYSKTGGERSTLTVTMQKL